MEKPLGKCFSEKYISLSWIVIIPPKLMKLIIFLGLLEHAADPSRSKLDWNISTFLFTSRLPTNGFETAVLEFDWLISI